jgi:UDP-N-acetylmuramate: L-alanyl-gamma-D-glutamyl-meso-diaminopimelate ligase
MHIHILGACGTFMGGVALLASRAGFTVTGSDQHTYPPMSTILEAEGIRLVEGYDPGQLDPAPDLVIVGNVISRGNPAVERVLNEGLRFTSGPRWLGENYLRDKKVVAVAGTHGKTTTSSMVAWILEVAGLNPGFLIGGVPLNFNTSARDGAEFFVVEADEYDTAFFDKRAKFVHYRPWISILNNLEYDHADIFPDLHSIQVQFHHLVRTIPGNGTIISNAHDSALEDVLEHVEAGWQ